MTAWDFRPNGPYNADVPQSRPMPPVGPERLLADELIAASNAGGGWSYYVGNASRLEPTCWALLALRGDTQGPQNAAHRDFLARCQRPEGWLVEDARWPVNIGFNALAAVTWLNRRDLAAEEKVQRLLGVLTGSKGVQAPPSSSFKQDNSLQGWSWTDATFSWVEPTAWGALALKKATRVGLIADGMSRGRIQEADRLLLDRCGQNGGWNFGNPNVMGQELFPHVPTTALALISLQDRRDQPAVARSLSFLESHWADEPSMMALGLSLICLSVYDRPVDRLEVRLQAHVADLQRLGQAASGPARAGAPLRNLHSLAVALAALSFKGNEAAFRI